MSKVKFIHRSIANKRFREWRTRLRAIELGNSKENFAEVFAEIKEKAGEGDAVMQDVLAYYYKDGFPGWLYENYKNYMNWEILAGANGNKFAIEKLQFFMGYAYDVIVANEFFPQIKYYNDIDEYNYIAIIGQRICEELVTKLNLDAQTLAAEKDTYLPYAPEYFRDYRRAVDEVVPIVIEKMRVEQDDE